MLLSLDISTSCTGYCIFNENKLVDIGSFNLSKHKDFILKVKEVQSRLLEIKKKYDIKEIAIEENLQAFRPGLSSANTLMKLAQFNGTVQWVCYEIFDIQVESLNVNSARKSIGLKIDKKDKTKTTKEKVLEWVTVDCPDIAWPTKILKSGKNKGEVRVINDCYDMADAYVIGKAFQKINNM